MEAYWRGNRVRTTVDIDPELLAEATRLSKARTKKEAIRISLTELIRRHRIEELKAMAGTLDLDLDLESLSRLRADE
jgi:Arc/MetJ family transcription regulator